MRRSNSSLKQNFHGGLEHCFSYYFQNHQTYRIPQQYLQAYFKSLKLSLERKTSLKRKNVYFRNISSYLNIPHKPPLTLHMKSTRDHWNSQPLHQPLSQTTFYLEKQVNLPSSLHALHDFCMVFRHFDKGPMEIWE